MNGEKYKIEVIRQVLNNAVRLNMNQDIIIKISEKLDQHIVNYYLKNEDMYSTGQSDYMPNRINPAKNK